jgi:hypothetical protein
MLPALPHFDPDVLQGNPTEWRRLWKEVITSPEVRDHVLRNPDAMGTNLTINAGDISMG